MSIASFSIKNKVLVNLISIAAVVIGITVTLQLRREAFPTVEVERATILTNYQGASPFEVEKLITIPIEDAIKGIDGIDTYRSISREGVSFIFIELDADIENIDKTINEISREVDKVDLPEDVEDPTVKELVIERPLVEISFSGENITEAKLRQHVKDFEDILGDIKGVASIDKVGWRDREISIEINPSNLEKYYISLGQVIESIRNQNLNLPGGKITRGTSEIILRTVGELDKAEEFGEIIVRTNSDGQYLYVKDIARIIDTFEEEERIYKTDSNVSINLIPKKKTSGDTIRLVEQIKKELQDYKKVLPDNVSINLLNDSSLRVKRRLGVLTSNGIMGLILVMITLLLFLNVRIAFITALGIPFAFLTALIFMSYFGVSLNMITMFGLILVLGMIVDDAIVVSENVYRYMEEGLPPGEATIKGASEVATPVTAAILTTVAAFLPLMYISGILGKFLRFFPMGVIACLVASLFEALVVLPSHLAEWAKPLKDKGDGEKNGFHIFSKHRKGSEAKWFKALTSGYAGLLAIANRKRYLVFLTAVIIFIGSLIFTAKVMSFDLFPNVVETFFVRIETPEGSSLEESNKVIIKIEKIIMELPDGELENVTTTVGFSGDIGGGPLDKHGSKYAQCVVYLTPEKNRDRDADRIISHLRERIKEEKIDGFVNLKFELLKHGPPVGKPVAVEVRGDDYETLINLSEDITSFMSTLEGVEDIRSDYELDKEEIQVSINREEAARLGLNVRLVAGAIRNAFDGGVATTMRKDDEDIDVVVRLPEKFRQNISNLENLTIANNQGRLITLNKFAHFAQYQGVRGINREEGRRTVTVTATIDKDKTTVVEANKKIIERFKNIPQKYPGYYFKSGGEYEDTSESIKSMFRAFMIAFILIYIILATQFQSFIQPLIVMVSIPFGIVGVIIALYLHGQPMSMMAMFGIVGLTGVVVNDSLVLVDFVNKLRGTGIETFEAVQQAGKTRLRPILLTSITTIAALLPLVYGIGGREAFLEPAAIAMSYGLLGATVLTLFIVPCVYLIVEDIVGFFNKGKTDS